MTSASACVRLAVGMAFAMVTTPTAHTVGARRRRRPTAIPAVEGVLDG